MSKLKINFEDRKIKLDAFRTCLIFFFPIPKGVVKKINNLRRDFFWLGNKEKKGYNLVKWNSQSLSKKQGCLSIKISICTIEVCFENGCGDLAVKAQCPVERIHIAKMWLMNQWITRDVLCTYGCDGWKTIRKLWLTIAPTYPLKLGMEIRQYFRMTFGQDRLP